MSPILIKIQTNNDAKSQKSKPIHFTQFIYVSISNTIKRP